MSGDAPSRGTPLLSAERRAAAAEFLRSPGGRVLTQALLVLASVVDAVSKGVTWSSRTSVLVSVLAVVGVLLRRRCPLLALLASLPGVWWSTLQVAPGVLLANFTYRRRRSALLVVVTITVALTVANTVIYWYPGPGFLVLNLQSAVYFAGYVGSASLVGHLLRVRREQADRLRELQASRHRERLLTERAARADERAQLAREMHDVVSHQISLIALQAGVLRVTLRGADPVPAAVRTTETIRSLAVQANDELRQVLGALTSDAVAASLDAVRTVDDIAHLWQRSGVRGRLQLPDAVDTASVPAPVQRAVYRITQEALTNVRRHADGADVVVRVRLGRDRDHGDGFRSGVHVDVENSPPAGTGAEPVVARSAACGLGGGGAGLVGISERACALGGSLQAGPTADGGFAVRAFLPCGVVRATPA
ncbi:histidine kinase [Kineococcus endophyticus]|uniref:histidine kinase n=1 Tax=Kineococcus endophyticus TaxID=1181883 RepID=A0ABV3P464_9ACTN